MIATMPTPARKRRCRPGFQQPHRADRPRRVGGLLGAIPFLAHVPYHSTSQCWQVCLIGRACFRNIWPVVALIFIAVAYGLTRRRVVDVAAHAPEPTVALRETVGLLLYGAVVLIAGQFVAASSDHTYRLHLPAACSV